MKKARRSDRAPRVFPAAEYQEVGAACAEPAFAALAKKGARPQHLLWASTGTKDPRYRDTLYVEELTRSVLEPDTTRSVDAIPATLADGRPASATQVITPVDEDSFQVEWTDIDIDGDMRPSTDKIIVRRVVAASANSEGTPHE